MIAQPNTEKRPYAFVALVGDDCAKPLWKRAVLVGRDDVVFVCGGLFCNERMLRLCLEVEHQQYIPFDGHIYAPVEWLAKEFPREAENLRWVKDHARREVRRCNQRLKETEGDE